MYHVPAKEDDTGDQASYFAENEVYEPVQEDNDDQVPPLRRSTREHRPNTRYFNEDFLNTNVAS